MLELDPTVTLNFDLLTQNLKSSSLSHSAQRWKLGEIQSQQFARYSNKAKRAFSNMLDSTVTLKVNILTLTFWPQKFKNSSLSQNAPMLKV